MIALSAAGLGPVHVLGWRQDAASVLVPEQFDSPLRDDAGIQTNSWPL
jgi:hypothetical protein